MATPAAQPLIDQLNVLMFGNGSATSLMPALLMWRTLLVVHAGPASGSGNEAASHPDQALPQNAADLLRRDLFGHLWSDPADNPAVRLTWCCKACFLSSQDVLWL
jgi:hypothetical protein